MILHHKYAFSRSPSDRVLRKQRKLTSLIIINAIKDIIYFISIIYMISVSNGVE
ncbi:hypothetical protein IV36_GL001424 [Liquorilactobacillus mali]|uniref:Uncharacterized protein n=3 Tax=Liquorilactobacillus TaxID=2767888 RepID=A0A0R1MNY0_9LACO|nr:hypothetical protein FD46_GL000261 [Liquorilactobacillus oeni DSM 19972]KRL32803.1 hypothetical protein FD20_GL002223 [Liquorilactobacillus uvarum DSM 19971]KRN26912.1 hypothetical protein IV36_GL001424 [Liquorilactobacillus mali]